jgi:hypothetical protein
VSACVRMLGRPVFAGGSLFSVVCLGRRKERSPASKAEGGARTTAPPLHTQKQPTPNQIIPRNQKQ